MIRAVGGPLNNGADLFVEAGGGALQGVCLVGPAAARLEVGAEHDLSLIQVVDLRLGTWPVVPIAGRAPV
eukprot:5752587-Pyramimonas_sp.AAC.1